MKKWKKMNLKKGDVFKDKNGKEYIFVGWMHGTHVFTGRTAKCTAYRDKMFSRVTTIQEINMVKHKHWIGGFMSNEGT